MFGKQRQGRIVLASRCYCGSPGLGINIVSGDMYHDLLNYQLLSTQTFPT